MPIGLGAWVPLVAGYRARHPRWILTGVATLAFTIFAFAFSSAEESNDYGGGLLILAWVMAGATSFALRRPYARRKALQSNYDDQIALAEHIDGERRAMTALATRDPRKAVGLGVGTPGSPGLAARPPRRRQPRAGPCDRRPARRRQGPSGRDRRPSSSSSVALTPSRTWEH